MTDANNNTTEITDKLKQLKTAFDAENCAVMDFWTDFIILLQENIEKIDVLQLIQIADNYFREIKNSTQTISEIENARHTI
jgi:hypothetical protein